MKLAYLGEGAKVKLIEMEASIHSCGKLILATDAASDLKVSPRFLRGVFLRGLAPSVWAWIFNAR